MSLAESVRSALVPIHREGYPFVAAFLAASVVLGLLWEPLFWLGLLLTAWCAYFFRDPRRVTPLDPDLVVSPADGRISSIVRISPPPELDLGTEPMLRISIFMNVFNGHINRMPVAGAVRRIVYRPGKFLNAELDKASSDNERNALVIDSDHGAVGCIQIAGLVARRIVCWAKQGEIFEAGERFGLIRFGSRLDVFLPDGATPRVALGQTSVAGETVLAEFSSAKGPTVGRTD